MRLDDCAGVKLRREDSIEARRSGVRDDSEALRVSLRTSMSALVWVLDGKPAAFFGLCHGVFAPGSSDTTPHATPHSAAVWLLTTDAVRQHPVAAHKVALRFLQGQPFKHLWNYVDAEYARAAVWLERLGFRIGKPAPWGALGLPFCRIDWRREWTHSPS
jgi:hypothetical protein